MKLGKKNFNNAVDKLNIGRPGVNQAGKNSIIIAIIVVVLVLIAFVVYIGSKATSTVDVVMLSTSIHKNQRITDDMLVKYPMIKAEYERYSTTDDEGNVKRRVIKWEDKDVLKEAYAAYPLQANTLALYSSFLKSRTDNSDSALYSFPGKELVKLDISSEDLKSFKTYLQPGDRINVQATYLEQLKTTNTNQYGYESTVKEDIFKTDTVFNDIALADLLNKQGQSILDLYSDYNELSTYEQVQRDNNEDWNKSVEPATLLIALTPEEKETYYYYCAKNSVQFRVSLPQRSN